MSENSLRHDAQSNIARSHGRLNDGTDAGRDNNEMTLRIGLWNGSQMCQGNHLLYRVLVQSAIAAGIGGGTVWQGIEGSEGNRAFRSIENEIASNELPLLLEFVELRRKILGWAVSVREFLGSNGVMVGVNTFAASGVRRSEASDGEALVVHQPNLAHLDSSAQSGLQVLVYTLEWQQVDGKPVFQAVTEFLRQHGILWVSSTRGVCGFSADGRLHRARLLMRQKDVPIIMHIFDDASRLKPLVPEVVRIVGNHGFVTSSPVDWYHPV